LLGGAKNIVSWLCEVVEEEKGQRLTDLRGKMSYNLKKRDI